MTGCVSSEVSPFRGTQIVRVVQVEPDVGVTSINYDLSELLSKAVVPEGKTL